MSDSLKILASMRSRHDEEARRARLGALSLLGADLSAFQESPIAAQDVSSNIEGFIGCTAVPTGVVGPLLYRSGEGATEKVESVYALAATSEGALVASMTRGAYALSQSGGFKAHVIHQKMMRAPAFRFGSMQEAVIFEKWVQARVPAFVEYVKQFSKHADLLELRTLIVGSMVECKLSYSSGDAAGQNMTTTCTWHLCLKIEEDFNREHPFKIQKFILDCSGSSDKRVSYYQIGSGRGVHVACEALIPEAVLKKTLKVTAKEFLDWGLWGKHFSSFDGSVGHCVNIANSVAALFLATGQDVACVHESSTGFMHAEDRNGDLYVCLNLPRLVIGTVGGGTALPHFQQALKLMGCDGPGKIERFASLIAGFALGLELSTLSAMVSGEFAMAHERMGRNRPKAAQNKDQWLASLPGMKFDAALSAKASLWKQESTGSRVMFASRPDDSEVLNALYKVTGSVSPQLLKDFCKIQGATEFVGVNERERRVLKSLSRAGYLHMPKLVEHTHESIEGITVVGTEYVSREDQLLPDGNPEFFTKDRLLVLSQALAKAQVILSKQEAQAPGSLGVRDSHGSYTDFVNTLILEKKIFADQHEALGILDRALLRSKSGSINEVTVPRVVVHNALEPKNVLYTHVGGPLILNWQWAGIDFPQRDILEFLAHVGSPEESAWEILQGVKEVFESESGLKLRAEDWIKATQLALDSLVLSKFGFVVLRAWTLGEPAVSKQWTRNLLALEEQIQRRAR